MIKKIICLGILIMGLGLFAGCSGKATEQAQSGAYFATGKGGEYAVIYDDYLSLFWDTNNNRFDVFQFSLDGDSYVGDNVRAEISFKVAGDILTIKLKGNHIGFLSNSKRIRLKRDSSKVVSEEEPTKLPAPDILSPQIYHI